MSNLISAEEMKASGLTLDLMERKDIHLSSADCWCNPKVEQVEGKYQPSREKVLEQFKKNPALLEFGTNDLIGNIQYTSFYTRDMFKDELGE